MRSVLLDLCDYGDSRCRDTAFADTRRRSWRSLCSGRVNMRQDGPRWFGASLGGTVVSLAAAEIRPPVDAMVNLSGPITFLGMDAGAAAPSIAVLFTVGDCPR